jgi:D-threo-aldose 1-dehydrogenase
VNRDECRADGDVETGIDPKRSSCLGSSDVSVTRLGLGTGPASRGLTPTEAADRLAATVRHALARGISYVDTAPAYYEGASEEVLGRVAREARDDRLVVSTKVGRLIRPTHGDVVFDFSRDGVLRSVDDSLRRTGLARLDVLMIHDPDDHMDQAVSEAYPVLAQLKQEGTIGAVGAGMTSAAPLARLVRETDLDCVLLAGRYTLLDQSALDELFPLCEQRTVSVIVGGVFNGGVLAGTSPDRFNYGPADPEVLARTHMLSSLCAEYSVPLKAVALQFPFSHPTVVSVLSGTVAEQRLTENLDLLGVEIPPELWKRIRESGCVDDRAPLPES